MLQRRSAGKLAEIYRRQRRNAFFETQLGKKFIVQEFDILRSIDDRRRSFAGACSVASGFFVWRGKNDDLAFLVARKFFRKPEEIGSGRQNFANSFFHCCKTTATKKAARGDRLFFSVS